MDIRGELEKFEWENATWTDEKLLAASPFRDDRKPSFFVWLRDNPMNHAKAGYWADLGAYDQAYARGGIMKLLAFLRHETEDETIDYLRNKYGTSLASDVPLDDDRWHVVAPRMQQRYRPHVLLESALPEELSTACRYLFKRGLSAATQQTFGIRYDDAAKAIAIPWRLPSGRLANIKYRKIYGKTFWYAKGAWPIRDLIFGIDRIYRERPETCCITEAEIDAMSIAQAGYAAMAVGGIALSREKLTALLRTPVQSYVILSDNDKAGDKLRAALADGLRGKKLVRFARVDRPWKDANEALVNGGIAAIRSAIDFAT